TSEVGGNFELVRGVGSTTVRGIKFTGISTYHDEQRGAKRGGNTVFVIESEGLRVAHLGDIGHTVDKTLLSQVGRVDVLMVPVGGVYTVDSQGAFSIVESLSPKVVIPMHFKIRGLSLQIADEKGFLSRFKSVERKKELEITKESLPAQTKVVVLEKSEG
ncbi:MAG: MBL fold metallo-hydrolase, partial [Planctomycetota bacterium]|nr:MBL fold metallo-hydrolase [Planctomycetota bacterium]